MRFKLSDELEANIEMLRQIRSDETASPAVRVQAAQALVKMLQLQGEQTIKGNDKPTPQAIMQSIRNKKAAGGNASNT